MPAKSAAYEKGIREGRAMAARSRNPEASEPEEEEEEEEMDMAANHSRKRSAKGAKHTKPAKDGAMYGKKPMDAECGCGRKGKCDGNCGSMRKRSDALTPLEYLDACELGIQDRSTAYIRARLDAAERLDLKCGKGSISEGEKCTKGPAQKVQPKQGSQFKNAAKIAAVGGVLAGTGYLLGRSGTGPKMEAALSRGKSEAGRAISEIKNAGKYGKKMQLKAAKNVVGNIRGRAKLRAAENKSAPPQAETMFGRVLDPWGSAEGAQLTDRARARRAVRNAMKRKRRDSIYATGFSPEPNALAL
jgi:hypothetical protein